MAISGMTSENEHSVGAGLKSLQNKLRFNPSGAHHPDNSYIGSIVFPLTACGVGAATSVAAGLRQMEYLDRGVVAVHQSDGGVFIGYSDLNGELPDCHLAPGEIALSDPHALPLEP